MLLANILGGPGLNSILNLKLREKHAYTYGVDCGYQALTDSGFLTIYLSTDKKNVNRSKKVILNQLQLLRNEPLKDSVLKKYKMQFRGQLIMGEESNSSLMFVIGRSLLDLNYVDSLQEILDKIESIDSSEIMQVANEIFAPEKLNFLTYLPK